MIHHAISVVGFIVFAGLAWLLSSNRKKIAWRTIAWAVGLQLLIGLIIFRLPGSHRILIWLNGAVLVGDYLYGTNTALGPLVAVEFTTGKVKWKAENFGMSSITYADGHLYLHNQNGDLVLVEATPEGYRERADSLLRISRRKNRRELSRRMRSRIRSLQMEDSTFAISKPCGPTTLRQGIEPGEGSRSMEAIVL